MTSGDLTTAGRESAPPGPRAMSPRTEPERRDGSRTADDGSSGERRDAAASLGRGGQRHLGRQAAEIEHERLLDLLEVLRSRGDGSSAGSPSSDGDRLARFELVDLLDRHYVRLCRAIGRSAVAAIERDLHELRVAHEWARTFEPLSSIRVILERHIERCPLETRLESRGGPAQPSKLCRTPAERS
jgi:hypothetical protein